MKKKFFSSVSALLVMLAYFCISFASADPKDIVLMVDNSGSMKKGDPLFTTKDALSEFVEKLCNDSYEIKVAVLIFDHRINLSVPLTIVSETTKEDILANFDKIDYKGRLTDIPAAMERAIYELNTQGRQEAQKSIIFITDGIVDTGDKLRDINKTRWLRENLSEDAARHGIKIFGIAFTESADLELIQSLAQKTNGRYFRAFLPKEIPGVFSQIYHDIMSSKPDITESSSPPLTVPPIASQEPPQAEIEKTPIYITEAPQPTPPPVKSKNITLPIIALILLAIFLAATLFFLFRYRMKQRIPTPLPESRLGATDDLLPVASLRDVSGVTEKGIYKIDKKVFKIGRIDRVNHIVINQKTISRQHAIIEYKDYSFCIKDQGSSNGTFLNGNRIVDQMQLNHGDTISFDIYEFEFIMPAMAFDKTVIAEETVFRPGLGPEEENK